MKPTKPAKIFILLILLVLTHSFVKHFIFNPLYYEFVDIDELRFKSELLRIAAYAPTPQAYRNLGNIWDYLGTGRPLLPGETLQKNDIHRAQNTGQKFITSSGSFVYQEKGSEPIWKSCLYKENNGKLTLVKLPGNCSIGTWWTTIISSNMEPDIIVTENGPVYIVKGDGTILRYRFGH
jgi:hypothetical protein